MQLLWSGREGGSFGCFSPSLEPVEEFQKPDPPTGKVSPPTEYPGLGMEIGDFAEEKAGFSLECSGLGTEKENFMEKSPVVEIENAVLATEYAGLILDNVVVETEYAFRDCFPAELVFSCRAWEIPLN
jgi:hypothetical protein